MLRVLVSHPDAATQSQWRDALTRALPEAVVEPWQAQSAPAHYAVGWSVPTALFASQPALRGFFCAGAGVDNLLADPAVPITMPLYRLRDAGMGRQMADYCSAAVLGAVTRRDDYAAQQAAGCWRELPLEARADWPIGILGLGTLGRVVAERFRALEFQVIGCTRRLLDSGGIDLEGFLRGVRVLILLVPLTPRTRGLIDARALAWLRPGAWLINVGRGALVDDGALLAALDEGRLAGAVLDVFMQEPLPLAHPFWTHPRVRVTPHAAAYTVIEPSARQIAAGIRCLESGVTTRLPVDTVDRARGY